jgi:hypothetical protein
MLSSGDSLSKLKSSSVQVSEFTAYTDVGMAGVRLICGGDDAASATGA